MADGCEPVFFRFRATTGWVGSQPVVGLAPLAVVVALLSRDEMTAAFGGLAKYEDAQGCTYLGVWGARRVGRFLALLRTRGLAPRVSDVPPEGLRQRWRASGVVSPSRVRRAVDLAAKAAARAAKQGPSVLEPGRAHELDEHLFAAGLPVRAGRLG